MKPRRFDYIRPDSVEEAVAVLAEHGDRANVLAGGQSLMAMLNLRIAEPAVLIDIARLAELDTIRVAGDAIEVGAAVTQNRLMGWPDLAAKLPLLAAALPFVGHFQTRNKGTVCGSIAHADPSSELPLVLATLGGSVVLRSQRGTRVLAAQEFQTGMLSTAREPDELIVAVRFPVQATKRVAFREVARRHGDFAILAVAAIADSATRVRIGIGGVADRPAARAMALDSASAAAVAFDALATELEGYDDMHASAAMRRDLLRRLGPLTVEEAMRCAA
jgi:2-furoyl-CoA dehydrogenase FAD binding subunit